jgi:large subunit ribosomal protein L24
VQTTLLGIAIALILALLAALIGPHFVHWNDHRAFFEAEATRLVGLRVKVSGDIDAKLLPFPAVTLGGIAIGPAGEASRTQAGSLRIELALGSLMRGELRATEIKLVSPQFSVGLDAQGQIEWPPLAIASETLSIDQLTIEDGQIGLTDAASGMRLTLQQVRFSGEVRSLAGPIRGSGQFVSDGAMYSYEVSAGRSGPDGTRLRFSLKTDERPMNVEAEGMLAFDRGSPRFDGSLTLARPAAAVLADGKAVASEPWRLTSKVKAGAGSTTLEEVSFQYGPDERAVTLAGAAEFGFGQYPQMQGTLSARQIDLDRLLATTGAPRRLPLSAVQAFGDMLGGAIRPAWPVQLAVKVDSMTVGGGTVQSIGTELRSDGNTWTIDKLEFRAPGFTHIKVDGRLFALGKGLGFVGGAAIDSNDPKNLLTWLTGNPASSAQIKPWHAIGDVTLSAGRIAVERLQTQIERGTIEGDVSYAWPADGKPARLEADLRVAELDLDALFGLGESALSGLGLERPGEAKLAIEAGRAKFAGLDARNISARFTLDAGGLAIERLSVGDFGDMSLVATGRIQTLTSPGGSITINLDARDLNGLIGLSDKFAPALAGPLRRLQVRQKTATLRAAVSLTSGPDATTGKVELTGQMGAVRANVSVVTAGKPEAFSITDIGALTGTDVRIDGRFESDESGALLALLGLDRAIAAEPRAARLTLGASGPLGRDLRLEGKLEAGPIDVGGIGVIRRSNNQLTAVTLDQFSGTFGGSKVQGRLVFRTGDDARLDGTVEADAIETPAVIAAAIGMPAKRDANARDVNAKAWSTEPFVWNAFGVAGRIEFKSQRATLLPGTVVQQLRGVARFNPAEIVFEDIVGEMGKGRLEGRLAMTNGSDGVSARVRVALANADPGALFSGGEGPALSGKLTAQTELEGSGRSPAAFMGSLAGFGDLVLEKAQLGGLNPGVFGGVTRAIELGIPLSGNRTREFVTGLLDTAPLPVARASATISVSAGQARLSDVNIQAAGADVQASASFDFADAALDARLTLNGVASAPNTQPGAQRPAVLIALKGALPSPQRTVDISLLTSWLTLRAVEQQSKQIDAMERAARDAAMQANPTAAMPNRSMPTPVPNMPDAPGIVPNTSGNPSGAQPQALPPPVDIPAAKPPVAPRADSGGAAPMRNNPRPPGLVGAQN